MISKRRELDSVRRELMISEHSVSGDARPLLILDQHHQTSRLDLINTIP